MAIKHLVTSLAYMQYTRLTRDKNLAQMATESKRAGKAYFQK